MQCGTTIWFLLYYTPSKLRIYRRVGHIAFEGILQRMVMSCKIKELAFTSLSKRVSWIKITQMHSSEKIVSYPKIIDWYNL